MIPYDMMSLRVSSGRAVFALATQDAQLRLDSELDGLPVGGKVIVNV